MLRVVETPSTNGIVKSGSESPPNTVRSPWKAALPRSGTPLKLPAAFEPTLNQKNVGGRTVGGPAVAKGGSEADPAKAFPAARVAWLGLVAAPLAPAPGKTALPAELPSRVSDALARDTAWLASPVRR